MRMGEPDLHPLSMPLYVAGYIGGISGAGATMSALLARRKLSQGQHVDISEAETLSMLFGGSVTMSQLTGGARGRTGRRLLNFNQALYCRDGSMHVIVTEPHWWDGLMDMMGHPEWAQEPEFATPEARRQPDAETQDLFEAMVQAWMADYDREELFEMSRARGINMAPYYTSPEVLGLEQLAKRGTFTEVDFPRAGRVRMPLPPYKLSATPPQYTRPAPLLGEHNQEVLCGLLGYEREDLPVLRRLGVI